MISKRIAENVIEAAMATGGDFAEIFMEDTRKNNVSLTDGKLETAAANRIHGAGIRVFNGLNSVYVYTNDTGEEGLIRSARQAAQAIRAGGRHQPLPLRGSLAANIHPISVLPGDVPGQKRANLVHRAYDAARAGGESVSQVRVNLGDVDQEVYIVNSEGLMVGDRRVYTRMGISVVASDGKENQTGFVGPGAMMGYELFETRVDVEQAAREAARTACVMLSADQCPAGVMPVVIDGGFGGVIFHEACGHSLEATAVARGNSEFCGKMGKQVASPIVTAIDDGTIANEWGSLNIDDEGTPTTRLVLIEKGILKNYMIDKLNGRRMNMPVTGSARRQSYSFAPTSRMRNTFIAPGEHDEDEIIRTMGDGLYAKQMGGGSVNPATGEFNFAVTEGYLVKDGKIDRPVRGATLIGKGSVVLMRIDRVGKKMWMAQGVCGSVSGSVNTNVGQPMIRVTQMTVGGR